MKPRLQMDVAIGAMQIMADEYVVKTARKLGCNDSQWRLLTGNKPWTGSDRVTVKRLLDQLLYGCVEIMGLPKFDLPAELAAGCISIFIGNCNLFSACSWIGNMSTAFELGNFDGSAQPTEGLERCTARQLFALVCQLKSDERSDAIRRRFADKTTFAIEHLEPQKQVTS